MPSVGTYYDPTVSYAGGGLDRGTSENLPSALWQRMMDMLEFITGGSGTWTDFTPTLTQSGAVTITVTRARYQIIGKIAHVQIQLTITGTGSAGSAITVASIPAAIAPAWTGTWAAVGVGIVNDASVAAYQGAVIADSATTFKFAKHSTASYIGTDPSFALANTDTIWLTAVYELA